nr:hypothetical protein [Tanacetum cinerariifolium]
MGYEKPSIKLKFYKAFFSSQWKFLIHTILQSMSDKRTSWNEFSSAMTSVVICFSTGRNFNFFKYIFKSLVRNVDSSSNFYMYPRFIQLIIQKQLGDLSIHTTKYISPALTQKVFANMRRVGKGCSGVETPLFERMLVAGEPEEQGDAEEQVQGNDNDVAQGADTAVSGDDIQDQSIPSPTLPTPPPQQSQDIPSTSHVQPESPPPLPQSPPLSQPQAADFLMNLLQEALDACASLTRRVEHLEHDKVAQALEITILKKRVKKLEKANKVKVLKLRRLKKVGTSQRIKSSNDIDIEDASNQGRMIADLDRDEDEPEVQEALEVVTTAKLITEVVVAVSKSVSAASAIIIVVPAATIIAAPVRVAAASTRRRKGVGKGIMVEEPKPMKKKQQVKMDEEYARKLHEELNKDIGWDVAIDHEQIEEEENRAIESINETPAQKAAKKRKLNEEVEDLKHHLDIVLDEDDDVYTEATPLSRKVPVVDYQIIQLNNKPHYKIIRANGTHQLYVSFITLLKNFDREDLESLWSIVKERFSTSKPNNFSDDYLLTTLRAMFGRPDGQDQVWKNQRTAHGQARVKSSKLLESCGVHIITFTTTQLILLVERRYPLSRFTLDQMLNAVRLRVEEYSEMSLELIRFTRQQLQEDGDDATKEQLKKRAKWDNDDFVCRGLILNVIFDSRLVMEQYNELLGILGRFTQHKMNMDDTVQFSCMIDKLPPSWKDFKHTLKHLKDKLILVALGSYLRIKESLRVHDSDNPKGKNVIGPSVVNMVEHNNSSKYNDNKGKHKHHDNTRTDHNKKEKPTC